MQTFLWNPSPLFPFNELERLMLAASSPQWPTFDVEDTEDELILTADLPGMTEEDLEVTVTGLLLIVRGERKARDGRYLRRARFHGAFERTFRLDELYDPDLVTAHIANGELTIRLEKSAKAKPRRIKLSSGGLAAKVKGLLSGDKDKSQAA
jgi:HSP20 family protein